MTRSTLSSTNRGEVSKGAVRMENLARIALPSVTLRGSTGDRNVVVGAETYSGNAKFIGFDKLHEVPDLRARRVEIQLSGLDSALISAAMNDKYHYAQIDLFVAFFDENDVLLTTPHQIGVSLYTSDMTISLVKGSGLLNVSAETLEVFNRRNASVLATPESQKRRYTGDTGQDNVRKIMESEIVWGVGRETPGGVAGRVGTGGSLNRDVARP